MGSEIKPRPAAGARGSSRKSWKAWLTALGWSVLAARLAAGPDPFRKEVAMKLFGILPGRSEAGDPPADMKSFRIWAKTRNPVEVFFPGAGKAIAV
jgi:hypothetical protein